MIGFLRPFEHTKAYDLAAALPLIAAYVFALFRDGPLLARHFAMAMGEGIGAAALAEAVGLILSLTFAALLIGLLLVRTLPIRKSAGIVPRVVALIGAFGGVTMLWLPPASLPIWLEMVSIGLIFFAMGALLVSGCAGLSACTPRRVVW
jgi:hypothetical protein